ncbi:MAG: hypothetical protein JWO58_1766 [Chitinophagaceae bacterium]|nr:hypothetical protein [Chitinophagaceae bacterium]
MRRLLHFIIACSCSIFFYACEEHSTKTESLSTKDTVAISTEDSVVSAGDTISAGSIKLYPLNDSPLFNDAILTLNAPTEKENISGNQVHFNYDIKNYFLTKPTQEGSCATDCANSGQGQHIHLILNNQPYLAKYTTEFDETLKPGRYVALSFLSRSYHESIKHYEAYDLRQFFVGETNEKELDLTQPMLFYSRPKGEYKGKDTKKILLDFYVVNATLEANGYKIRATINGNEFLLSSWKGYILEGLPMGESKIKIELLDNKGNIASSPYAVTERTITLMQ